MSNNKEFYTLKDSSTAEITEKKSRFIADAFHIENKEDAEEKINEIKKKYYDAKHNCFAFSFIDENNMQKIVSVFLDTDFTNLERRIRRINRLDEREDYA